MMRYRLRTLMIVLAIVATFFAAYRFGYERGMKKWLDEQIRSSKHGESPARVSVMLLGASSKITGLDVPNGLKNQSDTYLRLERPCDVTISLPGNRTIRMRGEYVSINVDHGIAVDVHLLPQQDAVSFQEAVADLRRILHEINIEPDDRMQCQMAAWPDESSDFTFRTETKISDSVTLLIKIRPTDDGRHYLALTFAADGPARLAVADGKFAPKQSD